MKKLILLAAVLAAFSVSSVFAGSCPGSGCGDKDKEDKKDSEKKSLTVQVDL
jgi:outer membrane murein-binding lipoprotein Lpp